MSSQINFKLERNLEAKTSNFRIDPLGYLIFFEKDAVYKMDTSKNLLFQQSLKSYGEITDMDVINPMKYLVFFREQQAIGFFDNTFTPYQTGTRLSDLQVSYATLVCYSMQFDRFWVFDQDNSKLILFNTDGKRSLETENLNGLIGLQDPIQMLERNGHLYIVDKDKGVYIFDMFGSLINFIPVKGIQWIQVDTDNFYFVLDKNLGVHNFRTKSSFKIPLILNFQSLFQIVKGKFYLTIGKEMHQYIFE